MTTYPRWPVIGIFLILLIQALMWAGDFLIPITAAVLIYLVLKPIQSWADRHYIGPPLFAGLVVILVTILIGYGSTKVVEPLTGLVREMPQMIDQLQSTVSSRGSAVEEIGKAAEAAKEALEGTKEDQPVMDVRVVSGSGVLSTALSTAPTIVSQLVFTLVMLYFLIASGDLFVLKTVQSFEKFRDRRAALRVVHRIQSSLGLYLGGITIINACLGVVVGMAMYFWDLPNPYIFGFLAFALNYIPFLGAIMGAAFTGLVGFSETDNLWATFGIVATYITLTTIEGQFITPQVISRRLKLNTPVVFVAVAFFAWIWSVIGMIVAVPMLVVAKTIFDEFESTQTLGHFLGDNTLHPRDAAKMDAAAADEM